MQAVHLPHPKEIEAKLSDKNSDFDLNFKVFITHRILGDDAYRFRVEAQRPAKQVRGLKENCI